MRDISNKSITLRTARAQAKVFISTSTIPLIRNNELPKGNLFEVARAAGFLAAKLTPQLLPHCHPVSIESMDVSFDIQQKTQRPFIIITATAKSIGRTGIEMETLTAATIAALEIYDMLKPVDTNLEISEIKLISKTGGKSEQKNVLASSSASCAILVCSDSCAAGIREDKSGMIIKHMLQQTNANILYYKILPDEKQAIQNQILAWVEQDIQYIFTTGGTGLGPRDNTVSAVREILERDADGITQAIRNYGQMRTPLAMMSRGVAGSISQTLIVTLPGSTDGARESMEAILPGIFHARKMMMGGGH